MKEQIVKLTGLPVSEEMKDILARLSAKEYVDINEINNTHELKIARSNVDYSRPTIQLDNRVEIQANAVRQMNNFGSARIDENGNVLYNGKVDNDSRLDIVIGLPASGKSSAIVDALSMEFNSKIIDNDEAKKMLPQYNDGWGAGVVHEESKIISDAALYTAITNGENIILPKVGSDADKLRDAYIGYAKDRGYTVNLHYVELNREQALGRLLNRFIETGRFLDPNLIDSYCNSREGNKIEQTYEKLKDCSDLISGYSKWNNDVKRGEKPVLLEQCNLKGSFIDNARTEREDYYGTDGRNTQGIRTDDRDIRKSGGIKLQSNESSTGESRVGEGHDNRGTVGIHEAILSIDKRESVSKKLSAFKEHVDNKKQQKDIGLTKQEYHR